MAIVWCSINDFASSQRNTLPVHRNKAFPILRGVLLPYPGRNPFNTRGKILPHPGKKDSSNTRGHFLKCSGNPYSNTGAYSLFFSRAKENLFSVMEKAHDFAQFNFLLKIFRICHPFLFYSPHDSCVQFSLQMPNTNKWQKNSQFEFK